ncbi:MAG: alcohol dehydrogenase [Chthoniobacter sp.]|nr:alcohol dehydrogenase [Chthoniobacter sp.]
MLMNPYPFPLPVRSRTLISILTVLASLTVFSRADDWPQWRGPNRDGVSQEQGWIDQFPNSGPPIAWKATVGLGFSSVVVGKGKAYTAGHANGSDTVFCFDALSGKELWKHSYPSELGDKFFEGGTTGSPTLAGDRLFWLSRWGDLYCYNANSGEIIWSRQIVKETQARVPSWGFSGAPTLYKNLLILNVGDAGMALEAATGKDVWKSGDGDAGYNTPLPVTRGEKVELWFANGEAYFSVEPETGKEKWRFKWLTQYGVNAADPIPYEDKAFVSSGYGKGAALFKIPATSDAEPEVIWKNRVLRTQLNGAVLVGKHLYGVDGDTTGRAELKCLEIETGKEAWAEPGFGTGGIIVADGKIIALAASGELMIAPVSPEGFKPTARAQVLGGKCWTAPVLANGLAYCRNSRGDLVAVDLRKN